jgi:hypothetical protein
MSYDPGAPGTGPQQPGQGWQGQQPPQSYPPGYGQQPPAGWQGGPGGGSGLPPQEKNFLSALFDFSFRSFATPGLIRLLYAVGAVLILLAYLANVILYFQFSAGIGLIVLLVGAIVVLFALALLRVSLEFYYAVVRMSEDIHNRR